MNETAHRLFPRWRALVAQLTDEPPESTFEEIVYAHSLPARHYHNLDHLEHIFTTLDLIQNPQSNIRALQLAVWFHDFVYDSRALDNEEQSATQAEEWLTHWNAPEPLRHLVATIILATKKHQAAPYDFDTQTFLDADLAILSESPEIYQAYAHAIRHEYAWVPDHDFRAGRSNVLQSFLQRPHIYFTPQMKPREEIARKNMQAELSRLEAK